MELTKYSNCHQTDYKLTPGHVAIAYIPLQYGSVRPTKDDYKVSIHLVTMK
jgi:hypothetical protein